jgi:hypothetical protein
MHAIRKKTTRKKKKEEETVRKSVDKNKFGNAKNSSIR